MKFLALALFMICFSLLAYLLIPLLRLQTENILNEAESDLDALYMALQAKQILYVTIVSCFLGLIFGYILTGLELFALFCGAAGYFSSSILF